jgi:hypothetical protein
VLVELGAACEQYGTKLEQLYNTVEHVYLVCNRAAESLERDSSFATEHAYKELESAARTAENTNPDAAHDP